MASQQPDSNPYPLPADSTLARLLEANRIQSQRLELLNSITRMALESSSLAELLPGLAEQVTRALNADGCYIALWNADSGLPYPVAGFGDGLADFLQIQYTADMATITKTVLDTGKLLFVPNYARSQFQNKRYAFMQRPRAYLGLPLHFGELKLGALLVEYHQQDQNPLPAESVQAWEAMLSQISLAVLKTFLYEEERQRRREAEALQISTATAATTNQVDDVLKGLLDGLEKVIPFDAAAIALVNKDGSLKQVMDRARLRHLPVITEYTQDKQTLIEFFGPDLEPVIFDDIQVYPGRERPLVSVFPMIHAVLAVILQANGEMTGAIILGSAQSGTFTSHHARLAQSFADQATIAIERERLFEQVRSGHERLQQLSHKLVEVQESERRLLARELHDEIGGELTALSYALEMVKRTEGEAQQQALDETQQMVYRLIKQVREMSIRLRPTILDDLGLGPALEWLFLRFQAQTGIQVRSELANLNRRFDAALESAAFRVVQEALTNVARYAGVQEVQVYAGYANNILELRVEDQGKGFDPVILENQELAFGLAGMLERTTLVGGEFTIRSGPGQGTCIQACFPVN